MAHQSSLRAALRRLWVFGCTLRAALAILGVLLLGQSTLAWAQSPPTKSWYFGRFPNSDPTYPNYPHLGFDLQGAAGALAATNNRNPITVPVVTPRNAYGDFNSTFSWKSVDCDNPDCQVQTAGDIIGTRTAPIVERFADTWCGPCVGNPVRPLTGTKTQSQRVLTWRPGFDVVLAYDTTRALTPPTDGTVAMAAPSLGWLWGTNLHKRLVIQSSAVWGPRGVQASRGMGVWTSFAVDTSGAFKPVANTKDRLVRFAPDWRYYDASNGALESYDAQGVLTSVAHADGRRLTYHYSTASTPPAVAPVAGLLIKVEDSSGRNVQFEYESGGSQPRVRRIVADTVSVEIDYDAAGNLTQITWPNGRTRQFVYEQATLPWALTGIVDENDRRHSTYTYGASGHALTTELSGGADRYSVQYTAAPRWLTSDAWDSSRNVVVRTHTWQAPLGTTLTLPNGRSLALGTTTILGTLHLAGQDQPSGFVGSLAASNLSYDANGNLASRDDFNGTRTCHVHDLTRNLETTRVEGLATTQTCATVTALGAALPTGSRKITTQWHPDWGRQAKIAEPGRLTTYVYNGQPDPFNSNAAASCASGATLPDGKPLAVLCKKVDQATTDADGAQGFNATLQPGVANRVWQWTYNTNGQVLTERDPLNNQTTNVYYTSTTADYSVGDLQRSTNALGHITTYPRYDKHGQVLRTVDPNGIVTDYTYDLRQRLSTSTTVGQTVSYDYDAVGQLKRITQPDQSFVAYDYDDAHRLIGVSDSRGNRIDYTLDNAGNRTAEQVKDPTGALKRQLARAIDTLGRVQQTTGRE
jgi:YD repeat-containing protein